MMKTSFLLKSKTFILKKFEWLTLSVDSTFRFFAIRKNFDSHKDFDLDVLYLKIWFVEISNFCTKRIRILKE